MPGIVSMDYIRLIPAGKWVDRVYNSVVVEGQAEEVGKRAPDKLRVQKNLKLKTRARLNKRARKQKIKKALESKIRLS